MPQPYPRHLTPNVTNDNIALKRKPYLAMGMLVIAENSLAEAKISNVLVGMLGADPKPAATIYGSLRNGKVQREAMLAVADDVLNAEDLALFRQVMKLTETASKSRDALAHSLWLYDDQLPDAVVLVKPDSMWRFTVHSNMLNAAGPIQIEDALDMQQRMRDACSVWRVKDFDEAKLKASNAFISLTALSELIIAPDAGKSAARKKLREFMNRM